MLAESVATWEQLNQHAAADEQADDHANAAARRVDGAFESRLIARAAALPHAAELRDAQRHVRAAVLSMVALGLLLALLGGVATARAILGVPRDEPANIFHVLAATLGPQTLLLLIWIAVMLAPRSSGALLSIASLGGLVVRCGQWTARRIHPGRTYAAAVGGMSRTFLRGGLGRWTFSSISHALWLAFNIGCLGMLFFLLSTRQYAFAWETTILSEGTYVPLTRAIAALPELAGFITPTKEQIAASQWHGAGTIANFDNSQAWSGLLVGAIVVYGFAPRVMLLGWSLGRRRLAKRRYRLDIERPEFARLRNVLDPDVASIGVVDAQPDSMPAMAALVRATTPSAARSTADAHVRSGLPAIIGFELPPVAERGNWPPQLHGVRWNDLGMVDGREHQRRVIEELSRADRSPAAVVVVCSVTTTPDRGVASFLADLARSHSARTVLLLTGGQRLRERNAKPAPAPNDGRNASTSGVEARLRDWRDVAVAAGVPAERVLELDLEHLTQATQAKLAGMIGGGDSNASMQLHHIADAMALIREFAGEVESTPDALGLKRQATLHTAIAKLYGDAPPRWRTILRLPTDVASLAQGSVVSNLASTAKRFSEMLPDRLKRSPKWLAAGATAGALGCVAAAAMISPVAIGALPIWTGIGAAIAAVAQPSSRKFDDTKNESDTQEPDLAAAVRSASLFAMLLELQGSDELVITRVLDEVVVDDGHASLATSDDVRRWLSDLQHRFDIVRAKAVRA